MAKNWLLFRKKTVTSQFFDITPSSNFLDVAMILLSSLVSDWGLISILWLVLKSWQFSFRKDWTEICKSEILKSKFCPISGDWGKLGDDNDDNDNDDLFLRNCWLIKVQLSSFGTKTLAEKVTAAKFQQALSRILNYTWSHGLLDKAS